MTIAGLVKSTLVDFPGLISCVLFTPGCNYDCFFCHNRQLLDGTHTALDLDSIMAFLQKRAGQLDGVVLSGGEPALQPDLIPFVKSLRALGYKIKLDTNGSAPAVIENILREHICDYIAVDYKAPAERYRALCGGAADAAAVLATIRLLLISGSNFEVRTTVLPQLHESDLIRMAQELPVVPRWTLNRFRRPERYRPEDEARVSETPCTPEQLAALAETVRQWQPTVTV
jgi:pyruvate formate lyase activating enzyme